MTYLRRWEASYLSGLAKLPGEYLRNRVRSTTTMLAGNPYMEPSVPVEGAIRAVDVENTVVVVYEICPRSILMFLQVTPYGGSTAVHATARRVLEELRAET